MEAQKLKELKKFSAQLRIDQLQMFRQRGMGHIAAAFPSPSSSAYCTASR